MSYQQKWGDRLTFKVSKILKDCRQLCSSQISDRYQNNLKLQQNTVASQVVSLTRRVSLMDKSNIQQMDRQYSVKIKKSFSQLDTRRSQQFSLDKKIIKINGKRMIKFPQIFAKYQTDHKPRNASLSQKTIDTIQQSQYTKDVNKSNTNPLVNYLAIINKKNQNEETRKLVVLKRIWLQKTKRQNKLFHKKIKENQKLKSTMQ